jgi:hypothetical protein
MTQKITTLKESDLCQFTGTESWYRHPFKRSILFTDGAKYVADTAGAYWLLDEITFAQAKKRIAAEAFQLWKLKVRADQSARLICEDGNGEVIFRKRIDYTDFPLKEISFYFTNNVILLPSEY